VPDFFLFKGLFADFSCIAAILPNDLAPTNVNGPKPTSKTYSRCCGGTRHCRLSLRLRNQATDEFTQCGTLRTHASIKAIR
jgi:hypothetical protein